MKQNIIYTLLILCFIWGLIRLERTCFKRGGCFFHHMFLTYLPYDPRWDLPPVSQEVLDILTTQKFHFLKKGTAMTAFVSEDGQYVIKFHCYSSALRLIPWIKPHKDRNRHLAKRNRCFANYKNVYTDLGAESALLAMHLNPTDTIKKNITLVDKRGILLSFPLDTLSFVVQKKATCLFNAIDDLLLKGQIQQARNIIKSTEKLVANDYKKGYIDNDPILYRNYGVLEGQAMHIDIGGLTKTDNNPAELNHYLEEVLSPLKTGYPDLF